MILEDIIVISIASQPKIKAFSTVKAISNTLLPVNAVATCPMPKISVDHNTIPFVENSSFRYRGIIPLKYTSSDIPTNRYRNKLPITYPIDFT